MAKANDVKTGLGWGLLGVAAVVATAVGISSFYTIDEGDRGVVLRNGGIVDVSEPGLHAKAPFVDSVKNISIRSHAKGFKGTAYTKDQQNASFIISVNYHIAESKVKDLYSRYQDLETMENRFLERVVPTYVKNVFGQYNAHSAIQNRQALIEAIQEKIIEASKDEPLIVESVQVEDIEFSKAYEKSIEERMQAEVGVTTQRQKLAKEQVDAEIKVTQAKGEAEAHVAQAEAEAKAIRLKGEAEADAIKARSEALKSNPSLVALTAAEKWDGKMPATMLPNTALPMINLESVK